MKQAQRLRVWQVSNGFGYAGTERALSLWARHLDPRLFEVSAFARLTDGPRRHELQAAGLRAKVLGPSLAAWKKEFARAAPEVLHVHRHGAYDPQWTAIQALARDAGVACLVETNVFGAQRPSEGSAGPDLMGMPSAFCLWRHAGWPDSLDSASLRRHTVFYNPVDLSQFSARGFSAAERRAARRALGLPQDAVVAGRLGRPDGNKWPAWLMPALANALEKEQRLHLVFMQAPESAVKEAQRLGIAGRCRFLQESSLESGVRRCYASLDILVHASRVGESFGYTLAEAMAWGLPVVVDSTPWADNAQVELVAHGVQGLVAGRPASFTAALLRLAADPALRRNLGKAGRRGARRFDAPALTRSLEGDYARCLLACGVDHPALKRLAARPRDPAQAWVLSFGSRYADKLAAREQSAPVADAAWGLYSRVRLYGRGWASKALKFWRWGRP